MAEKILGDEEFEKFLNDNIEAFPKSASFIFMVLREKIKALQSLYNITMEQYQKDKENSIIRVNLKKLSNKILDTIDQFDYMLINCDPSEAHKE